MSDHLRKQGCIEGDMTITKSHNQSYEIAQRKLCDSITHVRFYFDHISLDTILF